MLNISENTVWIDTAKYQSFQKISLSRTNLFFKRWLLGLSAAFVIILFLPWTQNIRAKGYITTLSPSQRPQALPSTISGRIEKWYVREGQQVKKGDTIAFISEVKPEYFDPQLLARTGAQADAKTGALATYGSKADAISQNIAAMRSELGYKIEQINNKIAQTRLKVEADRNELEAATLDVKTEQIQLERTEKLYKEGLTPLTSLENKRLKLQQTQAKQIAVANKYEQSKQEIDNLGFQLSGAQSEAAAKIAKAESDKQSAYSDRFAAQGDLIKLQSQYSNYQHRAQLYYITAPFDCFVTQATTVGIGEIVKEGAPLVTIVPLDMALAVAIEIEPIDLPLVRIGTPVRFVFDGWPALVFAGWPNTNIGTYAGTVFAIDNVANEKGKFRLLVQPDPKQPAWPTALRPGSGAQAFALFKDVPVWYEMWRQLNGFPPEYYTNNAASSKKTDK